MFVAARGSDGSIVFSIVAKFFLRQHSNSWTAAFTLPYLTFEVDATRGSIQRSGHQVGPLRILVKAEGYKNLPEAFASFRSKGHRMLHKSLKSIWLRPR